MTGAPAAARLSGAVRPADPRPPRLMIAPAAKDTRRSRPSETVTPPRVNVARRRCAGLNACDRTIRYAGSSDPSAAEIGPRAASGRAGAAPPVGWPATGAGRDACTGVPVPADPAGCPTAAATDRALATARITPHR